MHNRVLERLQVHGLPVVEEHLHHYCLASSNNWLTNTCTVAPLLFGI